MAVRKGNGSKFYAYNFKLGGQRFYGSTQCTNERDAKAAEARIKEQASKDLKAKRGGRGVEDTLSAVVSEYWRQIGQHHAGADNTERDCNRLLDHLGATKRLSQITDTDVRELVAWRRAQRVKRDPNALDEDCPFVKPATVNRSTTEVLKKLFTFAKRTLRMSFEHEPLWKDHWLKEPRERVRELSENETELLSESMRDDYQPLFEFLLMSGVRRSEAVSLTWDKVKWDRNQIVTTGKNGEDVIIPITGPLHVLLTPLRNHHPTRVFTYVLQRAAEVDGVLLTRGERVPMTLEGVKTRWRRWRQVAGITDLRIHDLRHDFATKLLRDTGNLKLTSTALNHRSITTTAKYAHAAADDTAAAVERTQRARQKVRGKVRGGLRSIS
jgi:site-specific recombinase XerD